MKRSKILTPDLTNWRVFNNNVDIVNFFTLEGSYEEQIVDKHEHDIEIRNNLDLNPFPKFVVKMEDIYDLKDRFKKITNSKTQSSTLRVEVVNVGSNKKPQNINLGHDLTSQ